MIRCAFFLAVVTVGGSLAIAGSPLETSLHPGVTLVTGNTWLDGQKRYRLYGIQSCLRATYFTNAAGRRVDCGDASLAVLAAFIKDTHPRCEPVAATKALSYVVCSASVAGQSIDLGTALISSGYAFAALDAAGLPINPAYAVAEKQAREKRVGLWQFQDVQHPAFVLGNATREGKGR